MALTKVSRGLLSTSIVDNGNATAITIDSSEDVTFSGTVTATDLTLSDATNPTLTITDTTNTTTLFLNAANLSTTVGTSTDHPLKFDTNDTERLRIGPAGQIGLSGENYGTSGQVLTSTGGSSAPTWQDASGGSVSGDIAVDSANIGGGTSSHRLNVYHPTTNVVARFESGDSDVWIDLHDNNSGTYGALVGHDSTNLFKVADSSADHKLTLSNAGLLDTDAGYSVGSTTVIDSSRNLVNINSVEIGNKVTLAESTDRADLLQITGTTSSWAGLQIRNSAGEGRWSFMTDGAMAGIYDDENGDWYMQFNELGATEIFHNSSQKLTTTTGGVTVTGDVTAASVYLNNTSTRIEEGSSNAVRMQTNSGYVDIGPMNTSWCHFQTDRAKFYFEKQITVDSGIVSSYNENLVLRRADNSSHQLSIGQGVVTTSSYIYAQRLYPSSDGTVGYFFNDSGTRLAYTGGDFYIQSAVGNYYNYATNQYLGNTSGDTIHVRGNRMHSNGWDFQADGHIRMYDSKHIRFGTGNDAEFFSNGSHMYIDLNSGIGNLYIRDGSTTRYTFNDNGSFTATGNITAYSDRRVKDQFEPITDALAKVQQLNGQTYVRTDMDDDDRRYAGLIAQDVEAVLPEAVTEIEDHLALDYSGTIALLVEAIKELKQEVNDLKAQLEDR